MGKPVMKRGARKTQVTKLMKKLSEEMTDVNIDVGKIATLLKEINRHKELVLELDDEVQDEIDDPEKMNEDMEQSSEWIVELEIDLKPAEELLRSYPMKNHGNSSEECASINLPKLNLPYFGGDATEWSYFWDVFGSTIHARSDISGAHKFRYLKGQLKGEASRLIDGFSTNNDNYLEAIKLLRDTFGGTQRIIRAHLHALFDLKSPGESSNELSKFRSSFECHIRALKVLNTKIEEGGFIVAELLHRKLPTKVRNNINRAALNSDWDLVSFREAINVEIRHLQTIEPEETTIGKAKIEVKKFANPPKKFDGYRKNDTSESKSTVGAFNVSSKQGSKPKKIVCRLCFADHHQAECDKFKTVNDRTIRAKELNLCLRCLCNNHSTSECFGKWKCKVCQEKHNTILCTKSKLEIAESEQSVVSALIKTSFSETKDLLPGVALPTAVVFLEHNSQSRKVRILFDQGSQRTFILNSLAHELELPVIGRINLSIEGFMSKSEKKMYEVVEFEVRSGKITTSVQAICAEQLPTKINMKGISSITKTLSQTHLELAEPIIKDDCVQNVSVLIGGDFYYKFVDGFTVYKDFALLQSSVGTMLSGRLCHTLTSDVVEKSEISSILSVNDRMDDEGKPCCDLQKLWSLDAIGIINKIMTSEEEAVMNQFKKSLRFVDGKYEAALPWRIDHPILKGNYGLAAGRLVSVLKKLRRDNLVSIYDKIIQNQLVRGFIEEVNPHATPSSESKVHYLPHQPVKKDSATTPIRIVHDCSAGNPSLNDCLYSGPCLIQELMKVLLRFRMKQYACVGDIEKAYFMVQLSARDRDSTRFLWPDDPMDEVSPLKVYRFKVVLFGATSSQFLLGAVIKHHLSLHEKSLSEKISKNLYVDNLQGMADEEQELISFYEKSKRIFSEAGLILREWISNSPMLQHRIECEKDGPKKTLHEVKVLGMIWNIKNDTLSYPKREILIISYTKREILRVSSSIYDPLGIITPITIRSRMLMQEIWKSKSGWDDDVGDNLKSDWNSIVCDLQLALQVTIPRRCVYEDQVELHAFADASAKAYGTILYFVSASSVQLVMTKSRVAPVRALTIPQLELTAVVLACRMISYIKDVYCTETIISRCVLWSDSQVTLQWLKCERRLLPYVQNRKDEIKKLAPDAEFRYVPSEQNPSDLISRGISTKKFLQSKLWFEGPDWLTNENQWPKWSLKKEEKVDCSSYYDSQNVICHHIQGSNCDVIELEKFSSITKLLKVTSLVLRAVDVFRKRNSKLGNSRTNHCLNAKEIERSELYWIKHAQQNAFKADIKALKSISESTNLMRQLNLFLDHDLIRCRGRIQFSDVEYDAKFPILLPNNHHFTSLIIGKAHQDTFHNGANYLVSYLRQRWWFSRMRQKVKSVIRSCIVCKRLHGRHYAAPPLPPLPEDRVSSTRPFAVVGVDYTGALIAKDKDRELKMYICLFTCTATRAVHLEVVEDLSAETFLRALRRFSARRSTPACIYSDNATNFTSSAKIMKKVMQHESVKNFLANGKMQWKFIPVKAPWFGGFYERLIGLTKNCLYKVLGKSMVNADELRTIVSEVEACLNNRPLSYSSDAIDDLAAITPSELINGRRLDILPSPKEDLQDSNFDLEPILNRRQKRCERLLSHFWNRWQKEYLLALRERKPRKFTSTGAEIKIGEMVFIGESTSRMNWKLGKILATNQGIDGHVRSATVATSQGTSIRPIARLFPLEISSPAPDEDVKETVIETKVRRKAAVKAEIEIAKQLNI